MSVARVVERLEERVLLSVFAVTNTQDDGDGSLRQAILAANGAAGADTIQFRIPGTGVQTIQPLSALPVITDPVKFDVTKQGGYAGAPIIDLDGSLAGPGADGLVVGGGSSTIAGLIVSGFGGNGIRLTGAAGDVVTNDLVGTNPTGTAADGNFLNGIEIDSSRQTIGPMVIASGNGGNGLLITGPSHAQNTVVGSFFGVDVTGSKKISNALQGIEINGSTKNTIGDPAGAGGNTISGNSEDGVWIHGQSATANVLAGNQIGTDATGAVAVPNKFHGVHLSDQAASNTIGGSFDDSNVISGNADDGVLIQYNAGAGNVIDENLIGTDITGSTAVPNGMNGMNVRSGNDTISGNVISGNLLDGLLIHGPNASRNHVEQNYIGTDFLGDQAIPNAQQGIRLSESASLNVIGGGNGLGNIISGNMGAGVFIQSDAGTSNSLLGNSIGVGFDGTTALPNHSHGIALEAASQQIGAVGSSGNLISGNLQDGILLSGSGATGNRVTNNVIGADQNAGAAVGNGAQGIEIAAGASKNTIGGNGPTLGNVISGNVQDGILLGADAGPGNQVLGNAIGLSAHGAFALPNHTSGIEIASGGQVIGGATAAFRNDVSGNLSDGIYIHGTGATGNQVLGNFIGTNDAGTAGTPNHLRGIEIAGGSNNVIGGDDAGAGNLIAFNLQPGVLITPAIGTIPAGTGNSILGNRIYANGILGIDLGANGVTPDTPGGPHAGANDLQNYPVLTFAATGRSQLLITGTLNAQPGATFHVEFFSSATADASGHGQGQAFIGSATVTTDASGNGAFSFSPATPIGAGRWVSATATDAAGNTSEFSADARALVLGDATGDGKVAFDDLLALAQHFGQPGAVADGDLNADGKVDFSDLLVLAQNYGFSSTPAGAGQEPASKTRRVPVARSRPAPHTAISRGRWRRTV